MQNQLAKSGKKHDCSLTCQQQGQEFEVEMKLFLLEQCAGAEENIM